MLNRVVAKSGICEISDLISRRINIQIRYGPMVDRIDRTFTYATLDNFIHESQKFDVGRETIRENYVDYVDSRPLVQQVSSWLSRMTCLHRKAWHRPAFMQTLHWIQHTKLLRCRLHMYYPETSTHGMISHTAGHDVVVIGRNLTQWQPWVVCT